MLVRDVLSSPQEHFERFRRPSLFRAGAIIGVGLGGFFDGIVFHQILGWHHLVCQTETCQAETVDALKLQNTQDGWFHLAMWLVLCLGIGLLVRAVRLGPMPFRSRPLWGGSLFGWGLFNFVEGLIDHQILGLHHVRPDQPNWLLWDLGFLAWGALMGWAGWRSART